jgi:hypothetical protein
VRGTGAELVEVEAVGIGGRRCALTERAEADESVGVKVLN